MEIDRIELPAGVVLVELKSGEILERPETEKPEVNLKEIITAPLACC